MWYYLFMIESRAIGYGALNSGEFTETPAEILEIQFSPHTRQVFRFLNTMLKHDMPGAKKLYTELPKVSPPSFVGKVVGRPAEITGGSPVDGYPIGAVTRTAKSMYKGVVYLCSDQGLRVQANTTGSSAAASTEIATELGPNPFYLGQFKVHTGLADPITGVEFQRAPLAEVLSKLTADNLPNF
jgi:hypothetical protein